MNTAFFRLVEKAASGRYLHSNDTPPCPPRPPLYAPQDVVSERTLKVMLVFGRRLYFILLYVELTISFLIGRKRTVNCRNQRLWRHPDADYTTIMSRTLKITSNHVKFRALCCLSSVKKQKHDSHFFVQCAIKQLLDPVFVIPRIINVSVRVISPAQLSASANNPYPDPDSGYHKNLI